MTQPTLLHTDIRSARIAAGLTQAELAAQARCDARTVLRVENRQTRNRKTLARLAAALRLEQVRQ